MNNKKLVVRKSLGIGSSSATVTELSQPSEKHISEMRIKPIRYWVAYAVSVMVYENMMARRAGDVVVNPQ